MTDLIRWGERLFLIPLSLAIILRLAPELAQHPHFMLFLVSELVGVALLLFQRRGETTTEFYPILVAFVGTGVALLVAPTGQRLISDQTSLALILTGSAIALAAKLFLGRSFGVVQANRGVKAAGVYRFVRHPMYAGYMINQLGFLLVFFSLHKALIYAIAWTTLWLRTVEEEKFLRRDPEYQLYAMKVRYRLIPGLA